LGDTSQSWRALWEALSPKSRALVWDLRGHGESESTDLASDYQARWARLDLLRIIRLAGGSESNPAVLIGHSLGGNLAMAAAISHPYLVKALVLISTGPGFRDADAWAAWNRSLDAFVLPPSVHPLAKGLGELTDSMVIDGLRFIQCPTLLLVGSKDARFVAAQDFLAVAIGGARSTVISGAGHAVHRSHASELRTSILAFLETDGILSPPVPLDPCSLEEQTNSMDVRPI
jgi:pimeloyl-ACP methyl ester carboxylesterase